MDAKVLIGFMAGIVFAISAGWYVADVAKKRVQVSLVSFIIFTFMNTSQLVSLIQEQVWNSVPFVTVGLISSVLICFFALQNHKIYIKKLDIVCMVLGFLGLIVWAVTDRADLNIYIISVVNIFAFIPLITKAFKSPELETKLPWRLNLVASTLLLLASPSLSVVQWIVPVRQFTCSLLLNVGLSRKSIG